MAASTKKTRTAYYKQAILKSSKTLNELLHKVFIEESSQFKMTENRHFCPNPNSGDYYVLNEVSSYNGMFYGELVYIEKGKYQTILQVKSGVQRYQQAIVTVDDVSLDEDLVESYQKEFIDNTLYFGVFDNHLVVIQTTSLKINRLGEYLNHLLSTEYADVLDDSIILFKDRPSIEARKQLAKKPAKQVKISQQLLTRPNINHERQGFKTANFTLDSSKSDIGRAILNSLNLDKKFNSKLAHTLEDDNLYIDVVLRRKGNKGKISDAGQELIDTVATSFVNLADEDFEIVYEGGKLTGKEFRLHTKIKVETFKTGVNHTQLKKDFFAFLEDNISDG